MPGPPVAAQLDDTLTYHFVGIGGYGMSGLAQILMDARMTVTGSDVRLSDRVERLIRLGARIHIGHDPDHVSGAGAVIYSTDVPSDNPELQAAERAGIPLWHRSELLARLLNGAQGIAVTGTHGKTTTTAMIGQIMVDSDLDPTVLVGADVDALGGNARSGLGPWVVAEACESDGSFLRYQPYISVVTNLEPEHLDHYEGSFDRMIEAFRQYAGNTRKGCLLVLCADDPLVRRLAGETEAQVITYGQDPQADVSCRDLRREGANTHFTLMAAGRPVGEVVLEVPGRHNVMNALAALAVGRYLGLDVTAMARSLRSFRGAHRRFEVIGSRDGVMVVDDYAHHPTEIRATLQAARERAVRRIIAVFQPQRYVRTHLLMTEFSRAFGDADEIVLTEIYSPPGERPIPGVSSKVLADLIESEEQRSVMLISDPQAIVDYLAGMVKSGDLVLTMGAGDIWQVARQLVDRLEHVGRASQAGPR